MFTRSHDLCSSSDPARTINPRLNSAGAPTQPSFVRSKAIDHSASSFAEPLHSPSGSFLVVKPCDDGVSFCRMNVFWPRKQILAICGAVDIEIEAPAKGTLILKTTSRVQTRALLKVTTFCGKQVTVTFHQSRNSCKGTIFAPELRHMYDEEILADLKGDGVTHIRPITTFKDGQRRDTNLLVLTFDSTLLPEQINNGWLRKTIRVFIPNPLRCFKCHRFGNGSSSCRQSARCSQCGEAPHDGSECTAPKVCLSCGSSNHLVSSSQCPVWKEEKAAMRAQSQVKVVVSRGSLSSEGHHRHSHPRQELCSSR